MARARTIKYGFFTNDQLGELNPLARLLFAGLWTLADRDGRLLDRPRKIKAEVLPYDDADVDQLLAALAERGFIQRYAAEDQHCIQIANWARHQNPHPKEAPGELPTAPDPGTAAAEPRNFTAEPRKGAAEQQPSRAGLRSPVSGPGPSGSPAPPSPVSGAERPVPRVRAQAAPPPEEQRNGHDRAGRNLDDAETAEIDLRVLARAGPFRDNDPDRTRDWARHLWMNSGLSGERFAALLDEAGQITNRMVSAGAIETGPPGQRRAMGYFVRVAEDLVRRERGEIATSHDNPPGAAGRRSR